MKVFKVIAVFSVVSFVLVSLVFSADKKEGGKSELICGFESDDDLGVWNMGTATAEIVTDHKTEGKSCAKITIEGKESNFLYLDAEKFSSVFPTDWSGFKCLKIDFFNASETPIQLQCRITSGGWEKKFFKYFNIPKGKPYTVTLNISDIKDVDIKDISTFKFFTSGKVEEVKYELYVDNIRFEK
jgi:hypothetical protein